MRNPLLKGLIFLIFFQYALYATNREFSKLTIEDGLSQSSIFDITQDEKGYLWITTQDGLNRYDGYSFKVFRHFVADSKSISDNSLGKMLSDKKGDIWVSSIHGNINQYHYGENTFSSYHLGKMNGIQDDASFLSMVQDSAGSIWFGIKGAIGKLNTATKKISIYRTYFPGKVITSPHVFVDKNNNIWSGDKYGLYLYNTKEDQFELFRLKGKAGGFVKNIVAITEGKAGDLWLAAAGHAPFRLNVKNRKIVFYEKYFSPHALVSFNKITALLYTSTHEVILGTLNSGVYVFNPQTGRVEHLINNPLDKKSISFNYILSLYEDSAQNLWVGTLKGLNKLDLKAKKFETFRFGTLSSIVNNTNMVPIDVVLSVYSDSKKNVWLGTYSGGLYVINGRTNRVLRFDLLPLKGVEVWAVREISDGIYLFGTDKGLNVIDLKKKECKIYSLRVRW
jgi:ligand-binding sensor domain-containing protein